MIKEYSGKPCSQAMPPACRGRILTGLQSGLLGNDSFISTFDDPGAQIQGQITATYDLGCFAGAIMAMVLGEKLGRRRAIGLGCMILAVGGVLQAASYSVAQMV